MNKSQKIVISIISVTLVLLILLGLTYAYFLTQIRGNTNEKSISVTTADLKLEYGDGNGFIALSNVVPNTTITPLVTKTFTVSNKGNVTVDYGVFLEDVINTFERVEDLDLKVECSSSVDNKTCNGYDDIMLINNDMLFSNSIDEDEIQTYTLTLDYKDNGLDQSVDMNKNVSAKVQIYGLNDTVDIVGTIADAENGDYVVVNSEPKKSEIINGEFKVVGLTPDTHTISVYNKEDELKYSKTITIQKSDKENINGNNTLIINETRNIIMEVAENNTLVRKMIYYPIIKRGTLAYEIIENAENVTEEEKTLGYAEFSENPKTTPAVSINGVQESTLSITEDDLGTSYYFRGNVKNNYVNFANMCWRIVRIMGDGSIKIVLEDQDTKCENIDYTNGDGNWNINLSSNNSTNIFNYGCRIKWRSPAYRAYNSYFSPSNEYIGTSQIRAFTNFQNEKLNDYLSLLKYGDWCYDDNAYTYPSGPIINNTNYYNYNNGIIYGTYLRFSNNNAKLTCDKKLVNTFNNMAGIYVSSLTADEIVFAGGKLNVANSNYYLIHENTTNNFWTMTPSQYDGSDDFAFYVDNTGKLKSYYSSHEYNVRPTVTLKHDIISASGNGTINNPYNVN